MSPPRPDRRAAGRWWRLLALAGLLAVTYWPVARWLEARRLLGAGAAEQARDLTEAKALLDRYLRDRPGDPEARLLAARVGWRSKLGGPLEAGWDRTLREHLKPAEQVPGLSHRASLESAVLDLLGGDLREAGARVRSRVRDDEPNAVALLEALARAHLDSHHLADAADYAGAVLRHRPDHALAHFWRGLAIELSGRRLGEADEDYRRAVELEPDNFEFRLRLAGYLANRPVFLAETRAMLTQLLAEKPDHPDVLRPLGGVLLDLGDADAARPVLERLAALLPDDGDAAALLGQLELTTGRVSEAERHLRAAVARAPGSHLAHVQLSRCLFRAGKEAEGKAASERADRILSDLRAVARLNEQARERPNDPRPRYDLGVLHRRLGDERVGTFWLRSALELDPGFEPAREALGKRGGG